MWRRDLILSLSLANLVYIRSWAEVLTFHPSSAYWLKSFPTPERFLGLMLAILALTLVFLLVLRQMGRTTNKLARRALNLAFLLPLVALLNSVLTLSRASDLPLFLQFVHQPQVAAAAVIATLAVAGLIFTGERGFQIVATVLIVLSPLAAMAFGQAIYRMAVYDPRVTADGPTAARLTAKPAGSPRVLWVVFDEWDQDLTFTERPAWLRLGAVMKSGGFQYFILHRLTRFPN